MTRWIKKSTHTAGSLALTMSATGGPPGTVVCVARSRVRKLLWRCVICFAAVTYVAPDVYSSFVGSRCQEWSERPVEPLYLNRDQLESLASEVPLVRVPVLPGGYAGMALPGLVALTPDATDSTRLHEMVHQEQMRRDGAIKYAAWYVLDWYKGRYAGCSTHEAYESISYEKQARATVRGSYGDVEGQTLIIEALVQWAEEEIRRSATEGVAPGCRNDTFRPCKTTGVPSPRGLTTSYKLELYTS